jgi:hypothetical protein
MSLKDEIQWASDHTLYDERSTFRHDEPVSAVIPVAVLRAWAQDNQYLEIDIGHDAELNQQIGHDKALKKLLAELEGL